ncbi:Camphor resistance CrcB protein [Niveomyces insectorum RCEF 264]|uniref:Camphor resistance CrcB protein n=1 Tax=Niveomyces insectorum RCEF 264 TaxID=1081102 RepID=A0A167TE21_9HYPO|nr:Camphor resistance CrcB protein [Niveomyces insectorum RCEF 264]
MAPQRVPDAEASLNHEADSDRALDASTVAAATAVPGNSNNDNAGTDSSDADPAIYDRRESGALIGGGGDGDEPLRRSGSRISRQSRNERRAAARSSAEYDVPDVYLNLDDAFAQAPVQNPDEEPIARTTTREDDYEAGTGERARSRRGSLIAAARTGTGGSTIGRQLSGGGGRLSRVSSAEREARMVRRRSVTTPVDYDVPDAYANLDELTVAPVENPDENALYEHHSLEETRSRERQYSRDEQLRRRGSAAVVGQGAAAVPPPPVDGSDAEKAADEGGRHIRVSRLATHIYTVSYLVLFALFGTLARLGLSALTTYAGAPVVFASLWPNFAGSLVMGFLAEDRMLFRFEWGTPSTGLRRAVPTGRRRRPMATKKTIPLYIGLATGFCGSFTSFSAFVRDVFLALSNDLAATNPARNGGYSFMAVVCVILVTVSLSLSGLYVGAHLAIALEPVTPSLSYPLTRNILDRLCVLLAWGCWLGAVLLSALPPDRGGASPETWRGRATFALVFAPLGCLARFYASLYMNGLVVSFPVGTFFVNIFGTAVLGMSWDLAHVPLGGVVGCQVLQGVEDGFCGCLTTVSTWVVELSNLRRRHAYVYGTASVLAGLAVMVAVMGGLRWTDGFAPLQCVH